MPTCGDGRSADGCARRTGPGYEACDDGNEVPTDACTNDCGDARCGDGDRRTATEDDEGYEACDDGNDEPWDGCTNDCVVAAAATARFSPRGEVCDDGNTTIRMRCNNCVPPSRLR